MASGEKSKARDLIAAIRTLQLIEREHRLATADERNTLVRFAGFGPVALSLFPDPVTGRFKDEGWRLLGEELQGLLTSEEYDSAKRTTFNAFYTSPTVIFYRSEQPSEFFAERLPARVLKSSRDWIGKERESHRSKACESSERVSLVIGRGTLLPLDELQRANRRQ